MWTTHALFLAWLSGVATAAVIGLAAHELRTRRSQRRFADVDRLTQARRAVAFTADELQAFGYTPAQIDAMRAQQMADDAGRLNRPRIAWTTEARDA